MNQKSEKLLKYSYYNVEIEKLDKGYLVFNSVRNSFAVMEFDFLKYIKENIIDESIITDDDLKEKIILARQNGFLVSANLDEQSAVELNRKIERYRTDTLILTIATTMNCNFACPYCYEKRENIILNEEVKSDLIKLVENKSKEIKNLQITWYGGEPLLTPSIIEELSKRFIDICKENNVDYSAGIVTNGYLLNEKMAIMLEHCKVTQAQVTLDGFGETHNKRRNLKKGGDSFSVITNNIDVARKHLHINIRMNVDKENQQDVIKLFNFCKDKKWNREGNVGIYFSRVHEQSANEYTNYLDEQSFMELNDQLEKAALIDFEQGSWKALYPNKRLLPCGAYTLRSLVVAPDGKLYKCWEEINNSDGCVGDLKTGININSAALRWLNNETPKDCKICKFLPVCPGDCEVRRRDPYYSECHYTNEMTKRGIIKALKKYYYYYKKSKIKDITNNKINS